MVEIYSVVFLFLKLLGYAVLWRDTVRKKATNPFISRYKMILPPKIMQLFVGSLKMKFLSRVYKRACS
jgi:hypothetical protein